MGNAPRTSPFDPDAGSRSAWRRPLLEAAARGEVALWLLRPGQFVDVRHLVVVAQRRPVVVVLSGDGAIPAGPGDFPDPTQLLRWAQWVLLLGEAGEPDQYSLATEAARTARAVVIIETTSAYLKDWEAFSMVNAPGTPVYTIAPPTASVRRPQSVVLH